MNFSFCLWFDGAAEEAAEFYTGLFPDSALGDRSYYTGAGEEIHGQPAGKLMTVNFTLAGLDFIGLDGGPAFRPTPSLSFFVFCDSDAEMDRYWAALSDGGTVLMPLQAYDFSPRYGWVQDRYGFSWQLMPRGEGLDQTIMPSFLFTGDNYGSVREAIAFYTMVFPHSEVHSVSPYGSGQEHDREDAVAYADFDLNGLRFAAMESGFDHQFTFNEAVSIVVRCPEQATVDSLWQVLSHNPEAEQCGWLKDRYGVSWQVVPERLYELLQDPDPERVKRVTEALLEMKKLDIEVLERV